MAQVPFFPFFRAIYFVLVVGIWKISGRCLVDGASGLGEKVVCYPALRLLRRRTRGLGEKVVARVLQKTYSMELLNWRF